MKKGLIVLSALLLVVCTLLPAYAQDQGSGPMATAPEPAQEKRVPAPEGEIMVLDLILVRPISVVALAFGAGMSILATPVALASGSTGPVYEKLVVEPFNFTVRRPLGEF